MKPACGKNHPPVLCCLLPCPVSVCTEYMCVLCVFVPLPVCVPSLCACACVCVSPLSGYLREYYFSLGDDGAPEERQRQLQRLSQLLSGLGVDIGAEAAERGWGAATGAADAAAGDGGAPAGGQVGPVTGWLGLGPDIWPETPGQHVQRVAFAGQGTCCSNSRWRGVCRAKSGCQVRRGRFGVRACLCWYYYPVHVA